MVNSEIISFKTLRLTCVVVIAVGDLCRLTSSRWTVRVRLCSETFCKWNVQTCVLMLRNSVDWWLSPCITTTNSSSNKERCPQPGPTTTATDTSSQMVTYRVSTDLTVVLTAGILPLHGSSLQYYFLGAVAKMLKATVSFVMSVHPSLSPQGTTRPRL